MIKEKPLLEIKNLHVSVDDDIKILNGINLTIKLGEIAQCKLKLVPRCS